MEEIKNMTMEEICRHNINLLTEWNEKHIEDNPKQVLENAIEIFKFYLNGFAANHFIGELKNVTKLI